jgi:hypothetical protein
MHRSRLATILIDCEDEAFPESVDFWSKALGKEPMRDDERYVPLRGRLGGEGGPVVMLQNVTREERGIHLDIETDDVRAEVARLEQLGARTKREFERWTVMEAPSGHAFCVVRVHREDFPAGTARWE